MPIEKMAPLRSSFGTADAGCFEAEPSVKGRCVRTDSVPRRMMPLKSLFGNNTASVQEKSDGWGTVVAGNDQKRCKGCLRYAVRIDELKRALGARLFMDGVRHAGRGARGRVMAHVERSNGCSGRGREARDRGRRGQRQEPHGNETYECREFHASYDSIRASRLST